MSWQISGKHFLKRNKVSLSLQGKQLTIFIANGKKLSFQGKNQNLGKLCHCELDSFLIFKDFPDKINGDTISESDILNIA